MQILSLLQENLSLRLLFDLCNCDNPIQPIKNGKKLDPSRPQYNLTQPVGEPNP